MLEGTCRLRVFCIVWITRQVREAYLLLFACGRLSNNRKKHENSPHASNYRVLCVLSDGGGENGVSGIGEGCEPGVFISFEGCDCSGKSTQIARLVNRLEGRGLDIVVTRDLVALLLVRRWRFIACCGKS